MDQHAPLPRSPFLATDDVKVIDGVKLVNGTPEDYAALIEHLNYGSYRANREYGASAKRLATLFPEEAARFERKYQDERLRKREAAYQSAMALEQAKANPADLALWQYEYRLAHREEWEAIYGPMPSREHWLGAGR